MGGRRPAWARQSTLERRRGPANDLDHFDKKTNFQPYHHPPHHYPYEDHVIRIKGYFWRPQHILLAGISPSPSQSYQQVPAHRVSR